MLLCSPLTRTLVPLQVGYTLTLLVSLQWIAIYVLILWDTYASLYAA